MRCTFGARCTSAAVERVSLPACPQAGAALRLAGWGGGPGPGVEEGGDAAAKVGIAGKDGAALPEANGLLVHGEGGCEGLDSAAGGLAGGDEGGVARAMRASW